jgi:hypothetical protein
MRRDGAQSPSAFSAGRFKKALECEAARKPVSFALNDIKFLKISRRAIACSLTPNQIIGFGFSEPPRNFLDLCDVIQYLACPPIIIWDYFIVGNAARMAPDAGKDEIILLLSAREHTIRRIDLSPALALKASRLEIFLALWCHSAYRARPGGPGPPERLRLQ